MIFRSTNKRFFASCLFLGALPANLLCAQSKEGVAAAYYRQSFAQYGFTADKIHTGGLTHLTYIGGATIDANSQTFVLINNDPVLTAVRNRCRQTNLEVIGSVHANGTAFNPALADTAKRAAIVSGIAAWFREMRFDGIDIDFEHPATVQDTINLGTFLKELRTALGPRPKLSAAVFSKAVPGGISSVPAADVNEALDMLNVMSYDHIPYNGTYANSVDDLAFFSGKGVLPSKMVLGVPFYGRKNTNFDDAKSYAALLSIYQANNGNNSPPPELDVIDNYYFNGVTTITNKGKLAYEKGGGIFIWVLDQDDTAKSLQQAMVAGAANGQATLDGFEYPLFTNPGDSYTFSNMTLEPSLKRTAGTYGVKATLQFSGIPWAEAWLHSPELPPFSFPSGAGIRLNAYVNTGERLDDLHLFLTDAQGRRASLASPELNAGSGWRTIIMPRDAAWVLRDGAFDFNAITKWSLLFYGDNRANTVPAFTDTVILDNLVMYAPGTPRPARVDTDADNDGVPDSCTSNGSAVWIDRFQHKPATTPANIYQFSGTTGSSFNWKDASFGFAKKTLDCNLNYNGVKWQTAFLRSPTHPPFATTTDSVFHFEMDVIQSMPNATMVVDLYDAEGNRRRYFNYSAARSIGWKTFDLKLSDFTTGTNDLARITYWRIGIEGTGVDTTPFTGRIEFSNLAWGRLPNGSAPVTYDADTDGDGIQDFFEDANLNRTRDAGETSAVLADTDGDSTPDGIEIRLGLDPLDPTKSFRAALGLQPGGNLFLSWPSKQGVTFTIRSSPDMTDWSNVVATGIAGEETSTQYSPIVPAGPRMFYRVVLDN